MSTAGIAQEMSEDLKHLLSEEDWKVHSHRSWTGRIGLVLSTRENKKLSRIIQLELTDGLEKAGLEIAEFRELTVAKPRKRRDPSSGARSK